LWLTQGAVFDRVCWWGRNGEDIDTGCFDAARASRVAADGTATQGPVSGRGSSPDDSAQAFTGKTPRVATKTAFWRRERTTARSRGARSAPTLGVSPRKPRFSRARGSGTDPLNGYDSAACLRGQFHCNLSEGREGTTYRIQVGQAVSGRQTRWPERQTSNGATRPFFPRSWRRI